MEQIVLFICLTSLVTSVVVTGVKIESGWEERRRQLNSNGRQVEDLVVNGVKFVMEEVKEAINIQCLVM